MKIEAIITCVNYSDFLEHTIPETLQHVDRLVVVTHPKDRATQILCAKFGVDCVATEIMHDDGDAFNKGKLVNYGLMHLKHDGWLLHIDADIVLPHRLRDMLARAKLDPSVLYGADRLNVKNYETWLKHKNSLVPQHRWRYLVHPHAEFPIGARLVHNSYGFCPIGFFQLWHGSLNRRYPETAGSAEHSDVVFAVQWPREKRILLPEFFVYHLESDPNSKMGANWKGRTTKQFGDGIKTDSGCDWPKEY